jgi:hypothetical protein
MIRPAFPSFGTLRLHLEIAYVRYGLLLPATGIAVAASLVVWLFWVPVQLAGEHQATRQRVLARQTMAQSSAQKPRTSPLQTFQNQLLPQDQTIAQLRLVFQLANQAGVRVSQVDMRRQPDAAGVYSQLQIVLPVKGSYLGIRHYCVMLLEHLHGLSIDQLVIRHDPPGGELEGQISLSLWQTPHGGSQ